MTISLGDIKKKKLKIPTIEVNSSEKINIKKAPSSKTNNQTISLADIKSGKSKIEPIKQSTKTHAQQYNLDGSKKIAPTVSITNNNIVNKGATNILNNTLQQDIKNKTFEAATRQNKQQIKLAGDSTLTKSQKQELREKTLEEKEKINENLPQMVSADSVKNQGDDLVKKLSKKTGYSEQEVTDFINDYNNGRWDSTKPKYRNASYKFKEAGTEVYLAAKEYDKYKPTLNKQLSPLENASQSSVNALIETGKGVVDFSEGVLDAGVQLGSSKYNPMMWITTGQTPWSKDQSKLDNYQEIAKEIVSKDASQNFIDNELGYGKTLSNGRTIQETLDEGALIKSDNLGGQVFRNIGAQIPGLMTGSETGSLASMGISSFGSGVEQAYNQGATRGEATGYGLLNSGIEVATEKMFSGVGGVLGKGELDDAIINGINKNIKNELTQKLTSFGIKSLGEGAEEFFGDLLQPLAQKLTYASEEELMKLYKDQNYLEDFVSGVLSAAIMQGSTMPINNQNQIQIKNQVKEIVNKDNANQVFNDILDSNKNLSEWEVANIVNNALKETNQKPVDFSKNVVQNETIQETNSNTPQISQEIGQNQELSNEMINTSQTIETPKNNIKSYTENDINRFSTGNNLIDGVNSDLKSFTEKFYDKETKRAKKKIAPTKSQKMFLGRISDALSTKINSLLNNSGRFSQKYETKDTNIVISSDNIEHIYNHHGSEKMPGQIDVTPENLSKYVDVVSNPDYIGLSSQLSRGNTPTLYFTKKINGYSVVVEVLSTKKQLYPQSYYVFDSNSKEYTDFIKNNKLKKAWDVESGDFKSSDINVQDDTSAAFADNNDTTKPKKSQIAPVSSQYSMQQNKKNDTNAPSKNVTRELENSSFSFKQKQLDIINRTNPADDDVHTWIRTVEDIKTFDEAFFEDGEFSGMDPDFTETMAKNSQGTGKIIVYSSYPIENGVFVSPSKMEASQYAGGDESKLYSKEVDINDVAWIDGAEGQYARVDNNNQSAKKVIAPIVRENNTIDERINKKEETIKVKPSKESISLAKTINEAIKQDIIVEKGKETKQRRWIDTSLQSDVVEGKVLLEDLDPKKTTYVVQSNKKSLDKANNKLNQMGYEESVEYIKSKMNDSKVSLTDVVLAQRLIQEAIQRGDTVIASDLIMDTAILGTDLGQKIQALSMIQRLTPEGQLRMFQKIVKRAKTMGDKSYDNVEITPEMVELILGAYKSNGTFDQTDLNNRVEQFKQKVAEQMKTTTGEKIVAWRYLSMLGNPKTHIRNVVSNIAMYGTLKVKNAMARTIETAIPMNSRTKTWKKSSDAVKEFAKITTNEMKDIISGEGKYSEKTSLESKKKTFNNKVLEGVSNFNSNMLSAEDWFFSKRAFESTLREYLTANGIKTNEDIQNSPELIEKAKQYAVEQAEIATFRQYSKIASAISKFERKHKVAGLAVSATIPFKKTPVNIAKTGVKYSPIGLIKSATYDAYRLKTGEINASQFVDNLSQGLTGTSLTLIGYVLAKAGILKGAGDDDKEGKFDSYLGKQTYSINIGGQSFSISWLSPVAMPLLVGANAYEQLEEQKEWDMNIVVDTLTQTLDPLSEMSFISGLTDTLNSYQSSPTKMISSVGTSMVQNYVSQFFPTLLSQIAATFDDTKRTTRASNNSKFKEGEETVRMLMYKISGLRNLLEPSTDIWGNEVKQSKNIVQRAFENFIAPYSRKEDISTKLDKELKRVYQETGESSVIPGIPYAYTQYDKVKYQMSAKEYTQYKKTYGETANEILNLLIKEKNYKDSPDTRKSRMIEKAFKYATELSKAEFLEGRDIEFDEDDFKSTSMSYSEMCNYIIRNTRYLDGER